MQTLTYDANGNMLAGLDAKALTYDGENRPLSVSYAGKQTCYVYGADGARLKKLEGYTGANCATPGASATVTLYAGPIEVRDYGKGASVEQMSLIPAPGLRIVRRIYNGNPVSVLSILHMDGTGSVRAVTNAAGVKSETALYRPYGEQSEQVWTALLNEAKGFIGERYDADAGLQYLNARYYDPRLGMFLQPDWWEVMQAGVGTNRYSYSFNDPVNGKDPSGHCNTDKANCADKQSGGSKPSSGGGPGAFERGGFWDRVLGGDNRRMDLNHNGMNDWADYQRAASETPGGLNFDGFQKLTGIDLRAGFGDSVNMGDGYRIEGPFGMTRPDVLLGLTVVGNTLVGTVAAACLGSDSFCGNTLGILNSVSGTYGPYTLNVKVIISPKAQLVISAANLGIGTSGKYVFSGPDYDMSGTCCYNREIVMNNGLFSHTVFDVIHEFGHFLGLSHRSPGSGSVMSYDPGKLHGFSNAEVGSLVEAYR